MKWGAFPRLAARSLKFAGRRPMPAGVEVFESVVPSPAPASCPVPGWIDGALALVLSEGARAVALARAALEAQAAGAEEHAIAHALLALVALREGTIEEGVAHESAAAQLLPPGAPTRAGWLLEHVRMQRLRRGGQLAEACAGLEALDAVADLRPDADAYLTAAAFAIVLSMRGDNDRALDRMYQALHLARRTGADPFIANALSNLGSFESDLYNLDDAAVLLEEALEGALRLGSRRQIIFAAGNLVQCLCLQGEARRALDLAREHLMARIRDDDPPELRRDDEIAGALLANGLVDEAEAQLRHEVHEQTLTNELATLRVWLQARILLRKGRAQQALAICLQRLAALAQPGEQVTPPIDHVNLLRVAADAAQAVGDAAAAVEFLREAFDRYEQLLGRAARARRLSLQIAHRLRQAEWERDSARQMADALGQLNASLRAEAAENARLQRRLVEQAQRDPLTGLVNRRHLFEAGRLLLAPAARRGSALAVALIDLDHFKRINDTHGHAAGDAVLRRFADLLRSDAGSADLACRYGGEEFVVVWPGLDAARAGVRLTALQQRFRRQSQVGSGVLFHCTFSAGVAAVAPGGEVPLEGLLQQADRALYAAKAGGRDRVVEAAAEPA